VKVDECANERARVYQLNRTSVMTKAINHVQDVSGRRHGDPDLSG